MNTVKDILRDAGHNVLKFIIHNSSFIIPAALCAAAGCRTVAPSPEAGAVARAMMLPYIAWMGGGEESEVSRRAEAVYARTLDEQLTRTEVADAAAVFSDARVRELLDYWVRNFNVLDALNGCVPPEVERAAEELDARIHALSRTDAYAKMTGEKFNRRFEERMKNYE